jgi:chromosome segregation ATPase
LAILAYVCLDIGRNIYTDFISRLTESQTRLSAVNLNKIEPDNFCTTKPIIDDGLITTSEDKLNQLTILRFMAKIIEENNQILLEKERLTNQISLLQSQLTDSNSKLRQYQNVHDELATTKSELEEKKRLITDIAEINLHLTNDDSQLRRELEDRPTNRGELENLQFCLEQLDKVNVDLAVATNEIDSKNKTISDLETENLCLAENVSQVMRKLEDIERLHLSNQAELEKIRVSREHISLFSEQQLDKLHKVLDANSRDLQSRNKIISELQTENIRLTENDSQLRRQLEHSENLLISSMMSLEELRVLSRTEEPLDKVHEDLAVAKRELESKNKIISELETENLRLAETSLSKWGS